MKNKVQPPSYAPAKDPGGEAAKRLDHLDSLRGIAALAVSFHHTVFAIAGISFRESTYPLFGQSPVVYFFLLSGFVLSRSLMKRDALTRRGIAGYYVRRIFRLYPVTVICLIFSAVTAHFYFTPSEAIPISDWMQTAIADAQAVSGFKGYCRQTLLLGLQLTHPVWTIRIELVASFLLPLVLVVTKNHHWLRFSLAMLLILICGEGWGADFHQGVLLHFLGYFLAFYLGYLICLFSPRLSALSVNATKSLLLFLGALWLFATYKTFHVIPSTLILAGALMVFVPCNWPRLKSLLTSPPLRFLGHISFSFYLIHWPILVLTCSVMAHFPTRFPSQTPPGMFALLLFLISVTIAIPLSALSECFLERPFNTLGHRLSKKLFSISPSNLERKGC